MKLFRIVKDKSRIKDLSGTGAFKVGGRWNSKGTYMLYTSENSSLAILESLVHFERLYHPPHLYLIQLEIAETAPLFTLPEKQYPENWLQLESPENKALGDNRMVNKKHAGIRVRSALNISEYNVLLNPLYPRYHNLVKITDTMEIPLDERLVL